MSDTRQHLDAASSPGHRAAGGVVGHVAELQQFDPAETATDPAQSPPDPLFGPCDDDTIEFRVDWAGLATAQLAGAAAADAPLPDLTEPPRVAGGSRRRLGAAVFSFAVLAALVAAGVGYASLNQPSAPGAAQPPPRVPVPTQPVDPDATFNIGAAPAADPARRQSAGAGGPSSTGASTTAPTDAGGRGAAGPGRPWPTDPVAMPSTTAPPVHHTTPPAQWPPQAPNPPAPHETSPSGSPGGVLGATLSHTSRVLPVGLGGYTGTVRIDNPGDRDVSGWRVTLTVPGGNKVHKATGASVTQDGEMVVFTPAKKATDVPAGGSVTFTFQVTGVLTGEPSDCFVDGRPCS